MTPAQTEYADKIIAGKTFARAERTTISGEPRIQVFVYDPKHDWAMPDGTIMTIVGRPEDLEPLLAKHSRDIL